MKCVSFEEYSSASDNLWYHLDAGISLSEAAFRVGTMSYCDLVSEARAMHARGALELSVDDVFILEKLDTGKRGVYQGKSVALDAPSRNSGGRKKFKVYRDSGRRDGDGRVVAVKIEWGDPDYEVRNGDDEARRSFLERHECSTKTLEKDGMGPGWWACNVHRFWKQLGLESDKPW